MALALCMAGTAAAQESGAAHPAPAAAPDPALAGFRSSIDNIDAALIHMLAERFRVTRAVGVYKAQHDLPPSDPAREARQMARVRTLTTEANLDPDFAEKVLRVIIDEVVRQHAEAKSGA